jgi:hypothetical protein
MARIPDEELERLKQEVSLQRLVEAQGIALNRYGADPPIAADMLTVFGLLTRRQQYPDSMGYGRQFQAIMRMWRPGPAWEKV